MPTPITTELTAQLAAIRVLAHHKTAKLIEGDESSPAQSSGRTSPTIPRVQLLKQIGAGTQGGGKSVVYTTTDGNEGHKRVAKVVDVKKAMELAKTSGEREELLVEMQRLNNEIAILRRVHGDKNIEVYVTPATDKVVIVQPRAIGAPAKDVLQELMAGVYDDISTPEALDKLQYALQALKAILIKFHELHANKGIVHVDAWEDNIFLKRNPDPEAAKTKPWVVDIIDFGNACDVGITSEELAKQNSIGHGDAITPPEVYAKANAPDERHQEILNPTRRESGIITEKTDLYFIIASFIRATDLIFTDTTEENAFSKVVYSFMCWAMTKACNHKNFWSTLAISGTPLEKAYFRLLPRPGQSEDFRDSDAEAILQIDRFIEQINKYRKKPPEFANPSQEKHDAILKEFKLKDNTPRKIKKLIATSNVHLQRHGIKTKKTLQEEKLFARKKWLRDHGMDAHTPTTVRQRINELQQKIDDRKAEILKQTQETNKHDQKPKPKDGKTS